MAEWKFTDQYQSTYPALANSILALLVFDVEGSSPVTGTEFNGTLDLSASGTFMNVLAIMTGETKILMKGTVTTDDNTLTVALESDDDSLTATFAALMPLIGEQVNKAWISINNETPAGLTAEDEPTVDSLDVRMTITVGSGSGTLITGVPMADGIFTCSGEFHGMGISLDDLNFLVSSPEGFTPMFPTTLPDTYYNSTTALELLSMELSFYVNTQSGISVTPSTMMVSIGIVNIPLKPNALFLNPLAIWVAVSDPMGTPVPTWGLDGTIALYPYDKQTNPPSEPYDFAYIFQMEFPNSQGSPFYITGQFDNPENKSVSVLIKDLLSDGTFDTGIAEDITLTEFDFSTTADGDTGTITEFSATLGMSSEVGIFGTNGIRVKDFSIKVDYEA